MSDNKASADARGTTDDKSVAKRDGEPEKPEGRIAWILGWVVLPCSIVGALFFGGLVVGAHFSESWFTRMLVWFWDVLV